MKILWALCALSAFGATAEAANYDCTLNVTERLPAKLVLQKKTGQQAVDPVTGWKEDQYTDVQEQVLNDLPQCTVSEHGYSYQGDYRIDAQSCSYPYAEKAFAFNSDGKNCHTGADGSTLCMTEGMPTENFDLADSTLDASSKMLLVFLGATLSKSASKPQDNSLFFNFSLMRSLNSGFVSTSSDEALQLPLDVPFFNSTQILSLPLRYLSMNGTDIKADVQPQYRLRLDCHRR